MPEHEDAARRATEMDQDAGKGAVEDTPDPGAEASAQGDGDPGPADQDGTE